MLRTPQFKSQFHFLGCQISLHYAYLLVRTVPCTTKGQVNALLQLLLTMLSKNMKKRLPKNSFLIL